MTVAGQVGLFIGAWGMANAISRMIGSVLGGVGRDIVTNMTGNSILGYILVFGIMAGFMLITLVMLVRINVDAFKRSETQDPIVERAALASDA
jgi:BCD family chlorophyll transporter-like MFS transporter